MIEIKEVKTKSELRDFIEFPNQLYKDNPYYSPGLYIDEKRNLSPKTNPAYEYCDTKILLAYKDGKLAGRICGIINRAYNEKWNKKRVRFNRWDVIDDIEVSRALLSAIAAWGKEHGLDEITGPIGFCDFDKQGLLVEGFQEKDLFITTYNHPYYAQHLEALGFAKDADWIEMQVKTPEKLDEKLVKVANGMLRRYNLRRLDIPSMKAALPYAKKIFDLVNEAYKDLYGVVPLNDRQIELYKDEFLPLLNPKFVDIILDEHDDIVAFGLAMPSMAEAAKKCGGRLFPFGWYHMYKALKQNDTIELLLVAVRPDYQNKGLNAILITDIYQNAIEAGIKLAETGPELELNNKVQGMWKSFDTRVHRRRRCYVRSVDNL